MNASPARAPAALVNVLVWIMVGISAVFLALRLYCKRRGRGLHLDDLVLFASWVALLSNGIITTVILRLASTLPRGATPPPPALVNTLAVLGLCSTTVAIASQSWSKTSFAITLLRLISGGNRPTARFFLWFAIVSMNVLFGMGAIFNWVPCDPIEKAWRPLATGTCIDPWFNIVCGIIISSYSGVMDMAFAVIPWKIIMPLQMAFREKLSISLAMSMGIFAGVAAFVKASKFTSIAPGSNEDVMQLAVWGVVEPAVTIMAASIPAMRILVRKATAAKEGPFMDEDEGSEKLAARESESSGTGIGGWDTGVATAAGSTINHTWSSTVASWGSTMRTWRSSAATWGSRMPTRAAQ